MKIMDQVKERYESDKFVKGLQVVALLSVCVSLSNGKLIPFNHLTLLEHIEKRVEKERRLEEKKWDESCNLVLDRLRDDSLDEEYVDMEVDTDFGETDNFQGYKDFYNKIVQL